MTKIMKELWNLNEGKLRATLANRTDLNDCCYRDLVKLTFDVIYNSIELPNVDRLDTDHITVVDNGNYQGTLLFLIPFDTYQPSENEYLMTYIGYGSCSGCDALQGAQDWDFDSNKKLTETQIRDFMSICLDLIRNTIRPYNYGWRHSELFDTVEEEVA